MTRNPFLLVIRDGETLTGRLGRNVHAMLLSSSKLEAVLEGLDTECYMLPDDECALPPWDMGETPISACPACKFRWHVRAAINAASATSRLPGGE
jgi:hypothetical protein